MKLFIEILLIVGFVTEFILGLFVYIKGKKKLANKYFCAMMIGGALWNLSLAMGIIFTNGFLERIGIVFGLFACTFFLLFAKNFSGDKKSNPIFVALIFLFPILLSFLILFSNIIFVGTIFHPEGFVELSVGTFGVLYNIFHISYVIIAFYFIIKGYRLENGLKKIQFQYIFIELSIVCLWFLITNMILPALGLYQLLFLSALCFIILALFFLYIITRYRFMDIRVVIRKSVITSTLIVTVAIFMMLVGLLASQVFILGFNLNTFLVLLLAVGVILFSYRPACEFLDRIFLKQFYDLSKEIEKLPNDFKTTNTFEKLSNKVSEKANELFGIENVWLLIYNKKERKYISEFPRKGEILFSSDDMIIKAFGEKRQPIIRDEIDYIIKENPERKKTLEGGEKIMKRLGWDAIFPLTLGGEIYGALALGKIKNSSIYSVEKVDAVNKFSKQISNALANIILYDEAMERVDREHGDVR